MLRNRRRPRRASLFSGLRRTRVGDAATCNLYGALYVFSLFFFCKSLCTYNITLYYYYVHNMVVLRRSAHVGGLFKGWIPLYTILYAYLYIINDYTSRTLHHNKATWPVGAEIYLFYFLFNGIILPDREGCISFLTTTRGPRGVGTRGRRTHKLQPAHTYKYTYMYTR